jgi:putative protein-disulfide isomerase
MLKMTIYYCYDAYCSWCFGFSGVMVNIYERYKDELQFEVLSGGMIPLDSAASIEKIAEVFKTTYPQVEALTGVQFGDDFLWHINHPEDSDWFLHSEGAGIAMAIFREYYPDLQVPFSADLQHALYAEGRDLTDKEAYRHLLFKYDIPADEFYIKMANPEYKEKAHYDVALVKQLQVTAFPQVLLQTEDLKFYLLSRGYCDYETLKGRIEKVMDREG